MSDLTVSATFAKNGGQPATGLILTDINFYLTQQARASGVDVVIWATQNPTTEMDNVGAYIRILTTGDLDIYNYFAAAEYTGAQVLDTNWVTGAVSLNNIPVGTAIEWTYPVTNSITGAGIEGVAVWFYSNSGATELVWYGVTDTFGIAKDRFDRLPRLDPGTYYVRVQRAGFDPDETLDVEVVV